MNQTELIVKISDGFKERGMPALFCGGCARDLFLCREPKDFDIVMMQNQNPEDMLATLEDMGFEDIGFYGDANKDLSGYVLNHERLRDELDYVIKAEYPGLGRCDILVYRCDFEDAADVVSTFDCTLNMVYLDVFNRGEDGRGYGIVPVDDYPFPGVRANRFADGVDVTRQRYIAGKFPQYQHDINPNQEARG